MSNLRLGSLIYSAWQFLGPNTRLATLRILPLAFLSTVLEFVGTYSLLPLLQFLLASSSRETVFGSTALFSYSLSLELIFVAVVVLAAFSAASRVFCIWIISQLASRAGSDYSRRIFEAYLHSSFEVSSGVSRSSLTNLVVRSVNDLQYRLYQPILTILLQAFLGIGLFILILLVARPFLYISLFFLCAYYLFLANFVKRTSSALSIAKNEAERNQLKRISSIFSSLKEIFLYRAQAPNLALLSKVSGNIFNSESAIRFLADYPRVVGEAIVFASIILALYLDISTSQKAASLIIPSYAVSLLCLQKLASTTQTIYNNYSLVSSSKASLSEFVIALNSLKPTESFPSYGFRQDPVPTALALRVDNLSYTFPSSIKPTLQSVSFDCLAGSFLGLIGKSGSGKSTLIDLLLCLRLPSAGTVAWSNELKLQEVSPSSTNPKYVSDLISYVPQTPYILPGSLRSFLLSGGTSGFLPSYSSVESIIDELDLRSLVLTLSSGLDTIIGDGLQANMSGGQLQRLSLARALLSNRPILLLDEATSGLDRKTESKIIQCVNRFRPSKTIILATHSLYCLPFFDSVLLVEDGRASYFGKVDGLLSSQQYERYLQH